MEGVIHKKVDESHRGVSESDLITQSSSFFDDAITVKKAIEFAINLVIYDSDNPFENIKNEYIAEIQKATAENKDHINKAVNMITKEMKVKLDASPEASIEDVREHIKDKYGNAIKGPSDEDFALMVISSAYLNSQSFNDIYNHFKFIKQRDAFESKISKLHRYIIKDVTEKFIKERKNIDKSVKEIAHSIANSDLSKIEEAKEIKIGDMIFLCNKAVYTETLEEVNKLKTSKGSIDNKIRQELLEKFNEVNQGQDEISKLSRDPNSSDAFMKNFYSSSSQDLGELYQVEFSERDKKKDNEHSVNENEDNKANSILQVKEQDNKQDQGITISFLYMLYDLIMKLRELSQATKKVQEVEGKHKRGWNEINTTKVRDPNNNKVKTEQQNKISHPLLR